MSRLTRKIKGQWDFSSEIGDVFEPRGGIVCSNCGEIVFAVMCHERGWTPPLCEKCCGGFTATMSLATYKPNDIYPGIEFGKEV
jgi:hypothetical protein